MARVGIADRSLSRGLYPAAERGKEPAAYIGVGRLALVVAVKSELESGCKNETGYTKGEKCQGFGR